MSQKQLIKHRLQTYGEVDNYWAMSMRINRLSDIIFQLRNDGMNISGDFGKKLGKDRENWKNYYYFLNEDNATKKLL